MITVTSKSYPRSRLVNKTKKVTTTRTTKHKTLSADKISPQLAYFIQKPSAEKQNVEKATTAFAKENATSSHSQHLEFPP